MSKPSLYLKYSIAAQTAADYVLTKHKNLLSNRKNSAVLDVGCGPGNITCGKILPLLPKSTRKVVGIDVSHENIEYAKEHFGDDPRVSYVQLNILTDVLPQEYVETFDLVLSLYCLHLVGDHRKALTNMFGMLRPGGEILLCFMGKTVLSDVYTFLATTSKWKEYMSNFESVVAPPQTAHCFEAMLEVVGFGNVKCEELEKCIVHSEEEIFGIFKALNLFDVPKPLEDEFVRDQLEYIERSGHVRWDSDNKKLFECHFTMLLATATK